MFSCLYVLLLASPRPPLVAAAAVRRSEAASDIGSLEPASSLCCLAACQLAVGGMAAHSRWTLCMVMMVGSRPALVALLRTLSIPSVSVVATSAVADCMLLVRVDSTVELPRSLIQAPPAAPLASARHGSTKVSVVHL